SRNRKSNWSERVLELVRNPPRALSIGAKSRRFSFTLAACIDRACHVAHALPKSCELRCTASGDCFSWGQCIASSDQCSPSDDLVEWTAHLSAQVTCGAKPEKSEQQK